MPKFGAGSLKQRATLHPRLQMVLDEAIKYFDFVIVEGHRGKAAQDIAFAKGNSQTPWPKSKHNKLPSLAADCVPYPIDWSDASKNLERYLWMHGVISVCAQRLGVKIRHGVDWNRNQDMRDERFRDYPHIELDE